MRKFILSFLLVFFTVFAVSAATYTVTEITDDGTGGTAGTLSWAITQANAGTAGIIVFNLASGDAVTLSAALPANTNDLTIEGTNTATGNSVTIQVTTPGTSAFRVFYIDASSHTVTMENLVLKGGDISSLSGTSSYGGSIYLVAGTLSLDACTISWSPASLGGGIYNSSGGTVLITASTIVNNFATTGIYTSGTVYSYYSWYNDLSGSINEQTAAPNITTSYTSGDLGTLADNGGTTQTIALSSTAPAYRAGTFVYYNATDGYYFLDNTGISHKLDDWNTNPTVNASDKITTDQRGETRNNPPSIGAYKAAPPYYMSKSSGNWSSTSVWYINITGGTNPDDYTTAAAEAPTANNSSGITINNLFYFFFPVRFFLLFDFLMKR